MDFGEACRNEVTVKLQRRLVGLECGGVDAAIRLHGRAQTSNGDSSMDRPNTSAPGHEIWVLNLHLTLLCTCRQANWKLDPPLRKACKSAVKQFCLIEDQQQQEKALVYKCLIHQYDELDAGCQKVGPVRAGGGSGSGQG